MYAVIEVLQSIGVFLGGILARFGLFLAMIALLAIPALILAYAARAVDRRREKQLGLRTVAGVQFRPGLVYAPGHTWLQPRIGGALELGLDDLAQRLLPGVSAVELPRAGTKVARGETIATLSGGGREVRVRAPVPGVIAGVNAAVVRDPSLVKREGYGRGWLVAIAPSDGSWASLPHGESAESWMRREAVRWNRFLEEQLGFAAADGGELVAPAPWLIGESGWRALVAAFLTV
jgi:glycine cleavage system H lipoate-binding protein